MEKFVVHESSMHPALEPGDRLLAWRRRPRLGDIVVFPDPTERRRWLVKRLVAGGGATVRIESNHLEISHEDGRSSAWSLPHVENPRSWEVGDAEAFVLSDALAATRADSRVYGPVSTRDMLTVTMRYSPLRRFTWRP